MSLKKDLTKTLSFEDLAVTFLLELLEAKKASGVLCVFVARGGRFFFLRLSVGPKDCSS